MFLISFHLRSINLIRVCLVFLGLLWLGAVATRATPYYVETNGNDGGAGTSWATAKKTIQAGVDVASSSGSDTVWVSNGTYTLTAQINVNKPITLQSFKGRDLTFINGDYPTRTIRCISISTNAVVSGFTISNGCITSGGAGVYMWYAPNYSQMILTNCVIVGNRTTAADSQGGGVYCYGSNVLIVDCVVTGNTSSQYGGGVMPYYSTIKNCTIINNSATSEGGGVFGQYGSVISNCEFIGNTKGGIRAQSSCVVDSCLIASNQTAYGVRFTASTPPCVLKNSVIRDNLAGGVYIDEGNVVKNCLITRNSGNALKLSSVQTYTGYVANCTIVSNDYENYAMVIGGSTTDTVFNCIIASNRYGITMDGGTTNAFWNCCAPGYTTFPPGRGNITSDPRFIDAIPGSANNWRLANNNSPCVNTGTNMSWMTNSLDLDGRTRIRYGRVDMGAYELINQATLYGFR